MIPYLYRIQPWPHPRYASAATGTMGGVPPYPLLSRAVRTPA